MTQRPELRECAAVLAVLESADRAWGLPDMATSPLLQPVSAARLEQVLPELEALGYVGRRMGEALEVYRLSPLGRRTLHHWLATGQWRSRTENVGPL